MATVVAKSSVCEVTSIATSELTGQKPSKCPSGIDGYHLGASPRGVGAFEALAGADGEASIGPKRLAADILRVKPKPTSGLYGSASSGTALRGGKSGGTALLPEPTAGGDRELVRRAIEALRHERAH